jgi:hypothetical protein
MKQIMEPSKVINIKFRLKIMGKVYLKMCIIFVQDFRFDVDPSLCSKQRQLKRAKLADSLASQLSHRPGPLELIQKNILHTDDPVEQLVKQGSIAFTPTAEGVPCKPPVAALVAGAADGADEDSSDAAPSPLAPGELVSGRVFCALPVIPHSVADPDGFIPDLAIYRYRI